MIVWIKFCWLLVFCVNLYSKTSSREGHRFWFLKTSFSVPPTPWRGPTLINLFGSPCVYGSLLPSVFFFFFCIPIKNYLYKQVTGRIWLIGYTLPTVWFIPKYTAVQLVSHIPALCNPRDCSTAGFPIFPYILEFAQTHVHFVGDAIQPSHPLSPTSSPDLGIPQHQGLFQWVGSLYQAAEVLELQLLHQSFWWIFKVDFL